MRILAAAGLTALALTLAACSQAEAPAASGAAQEADAGILSGSISILDGVVYIPPGDRDVTAAFGTLAAGERAVSVVGAEADFAEAVEMHTHAMGEDGRMAMRQVESFDIPANGAHELRRGGDHLMLFGVDRASLVAGETVEVTFRGEFEDGTTEDIVLTLTVSEL